MKCMFCSVHSEDRRLLAAHIRTAHEDKIHARTLAHALEHGGSSYRSLVELTVVEIDIDAAHARQQPAGA